MSSTTSITTEDRQTLEQFVQSGPSVSVALVRALAAVVCADGVVSLPEISAMTEAAAQLDESNLCVYTALRSIELRPTVDASLRLLSAQSGGLDAAQRNRLLQLALPVIALQGGEALGHAERFAEALQADLPPSQRTTLEAQASAPLWKVFTAQSVRRVTASGEIQAARDCYHATRSPDVAKALADFLKGDVDAAALARHVSAARASFLEALEAIETAARTAYSTEGMSDALLKAARQLQTQIEQRLKLIRARTDLEKREFDESLEDLINDAGNAFEVEALGLFREADERKPGTWTQLARSSFGRELERRITRAERLYAQRLSLLQQEVSIFASDYGYAVTQLLASVHHARLAPAMPGLRMGTRVLNALEGAADLTLKGGAVAGVGTGAALYFLGAAAVLPVVAPAAPVVAGAMLVAGLVKWVMDNEARLGREIAHKRGAFEDELRQHLQAMRTSFFGQLDQTQRSFEDTATAVMTPLLLEAYAQAGLQQVQNRLTLDAVRTARTLLAKRS
jgi:hypothetical protein